MYILYRRPVGLFTLINIAPGYGGLVQKGTCRPKLKWKAFVRRYCLAYFHILQWGFKRPHNILNYSDTAGK